MILYHGSNTLIDTIELGRCRPYKDFGKGFYLTDIAEQAQRMADRIARIYGGEPFVTKFNFDYASAIDSNSGLKIKRFSLPDNEWAQFVMANRDINTPQPFHDYDIVIGPVADDTISRLLRQYAENFISNEQLLNELKYTRPTSQFFFHTERAIDFLKKL